jgi:cytochrome c oxidase subunit 2
VIAFYAAIITLIVSLAVVAITVFVSRSRFPLKEAAATTKAVYRVRFIYFIALAGVALVALAMTLPITPYPGRYAGQKPDAVVNVMGTMWSWTFTPGAGAASAAGTLVLPVGKLVEFDVSSQDVNHDFAIYDASGRLIAQAQAMPNYTNRLFYRFERSGRYYVLCLEYCGVAHHLMNAEFDVK